MTDGIRTRMRTNAALVLPLAIGFAAAVATLVVAARLHLSGNLAFTLAPLLGLCAGGVATKWPRVEVEVTADAVRIGRRSFSLVDGAAQLKGGELEDWTVGRTLEVLLSRKKGKRKSLSVQDIHALLTYLERNDGLRGQLETAAWGMVDQGEKAGSKGPELKVWVAEGRVVRGELVAARGQVSPDPDQRGPVPEDAACYLVPTRFELPTRGRAWLETEVERTKRAEG
jgi:hypothetical protein